MIDSNFFYPFSDREMLSLHAEVLYMTEVEKMKPERQAALRMKSIRESINRTIINDIYPPITALDSSGLYFPSSSAGDR